MKNAKMVRLLLTLFVCLILSLPNCQKDSAEKSDASIIAKIDDFEITYKQFSDHFKKLYPRKNPRKASTQLKKQVLDDMINQLLTLQEAYRLGYDKRPDVVDVIAKKEKILAAEAYEKKEVYDKVLTTQLLRQYYTWSKRKLKLRRMKFVYGTDSSLVEEKKQKAYDVYRKLQKGADFKRLAVLYSEHQNAQNDSGSLGAIDCFQMDEDIFGRAYDLPVGEAGEPFHANNAYYILLVEKRIPQKVRAFEKERAQIVENLKEKYAFKLSHEFFQLRKNLRTEYHYRLLSENIDFFCNRAKAIITKEDSTDLFNETERSVALCESDINKITIGEFFRKAFPFFWNSLDEKRLVEKLLSKDCMEQLTQYKAMQAGLNELPDVKENLDEWLVGYLKAKVIEKEVTEKIDVSDNVLKPIYYARKNSLMLKERRTVREIFQKTEEGINRVYKLAMESNDFEALEKKYQQNMETKTNGIIGPFIKGPHGKLGEHAFDLHVGEISKPFRYRGGYSIIKLLSIEPARRKTFEEAKEQLKAEYLEDNYDKFLSQWYEKIRKNYRIKIHDKI